MATTRVAIKTTTDSAWVSATDLMSGLMIVFMFIAIAFMKNVSNIAEDWAMKKEQIYQALMREFHDDLPKWNAAIDKQTLTVRFREPTILFSQGEAVISEQFDRILGNFFPRYANVLQEFAGDIAEIRIEGHTSSEWGHEFSPVAAYVQNLRLSSDRAREVLVHCISQLDPDGPPYLWARDKMLAAGFSSSRVVREEGTEEEDQEASRRVEFRVRTRAEEKLSSILGSKGKFEARVFRGNGQRVPSP